MLLDEAELPCLFAFTSFTRQLGACRLDRGQGRKGVRKHDRREKVHFEDFREIRLKEKGRGNIDFPVKSFERKFPVLDIKYNFKKGQEG